MPVDTKKVEGRRQLQFGSLDEVLADAERLAADRQAKTLGNWSMGQVFQHLANALNMGIDGSSFRPRWYVRWFAPMMKGKFINKGLHPGFKLPDGLERELVADGSTSTEDGLDALQKAVARWKEVPDRKPHSAFGKLTDEEWDKLHLRHAELHLSFVVPAGESG